MKKNRSTTLTRGINVTGTVSQPCPYPSPPPLYANNEAPKADINNDGLGWGLVGAGFGFWLLVAVSCFVYCRRRRQARDAADEEEKKALHLQDAQKMKHKLGIKSSSDVTEDPPVANQV